MAESESSSGEGQGVSDSPESGAPEKGASVAIDRIYLKDLSFESPNSPEVFRGDWKPEVSVDLNTRSARLDGDFFEVVLTLTVTAKNKDSEQGYLVEVQQAGLFNIVGVAGEQLKTILGTFCPNTLFPYIREVIDSSVAKGGFPPLQLAPFNFDALYRQAQAEAQANAGGEPAPVQPPSDTTH